MSAKRENNAPIYQLKVTLKGIRPPIWRRLQVRGDITLYKLHRTLQVAFDWWDYHLHQFDVGGVYYGTPDPEIELNWKSERRIRLAEAAPDPKSKFIYEYDFGDGWEHEVVVEKILGPEPGVGYPRCIGGKRRAPPEDVGGPWGYQHFLEAIRDPEHEEHEGYLEWAGGEFDPDAFDPDEVDEGLAELRRG